ncbi:MAG: NUDIX domain-containing protein [bacterium]|nr:NUDIX domain-containing protein [bacterium]
MKFCFECGNGLILKECYNCGILDGIFPFCEKCEEFRFPFFNCAVSMVIYNKDFSKTLLIKQYGRDWNILVAGYVNKKENLEEALKREILEETALEPLDFKYNESKYFEKSNTLICNFIVRVKNEDFKLTEEVDFAKWYGIDEAKREIMKNGLAEYFFNLSLLKLDMFN